MAALCNDLLDVGAVRAEVDKREAEGHFIAGRGGEGGAFAMRSAEERAKRQAVGDQACIHCQHCMTPYQILF